MKKLLILILLAGSICSCSQSSFCPTYGNMQGSKKYYKHTVYQKTLKR